MAVEGGPVALSCDTRTLPGVILIFTVLCYNFYLKYIYIKGQLNHDVHSFPAVHKMEGKTHNFLEKLKITSGKSTLFGRFL